jgi:hypothetical protein
MTKLTTISCTLVLFTAVAHAGDPKAGAPAIPKPAMEAPKPSQEIADLGKGITGSWKCTGTGVMGGQTMQVKGT